MLTAVFNDDWINDGKERVGMERVGEYWLWEKVSRGVNSGREEKGRGGNIARIFRDIY